MVPLWLPVSAVMTTELSGSLYDKSVTALVNSSLLSLAWTTFWLETSPAPFASLLLQGDDGDQAPLYQIISTN
jgi:hypothetical protein